MIVNKNDYVNQLPIYEIEEVTIEQAFRLLSIRQKYAGETAVSRMGNRLRIPGEFDETQQLLEKVVTAWGPTGARG
jgi:hypothetical protein